MNKIILYIILISSTLFSCQRKTEQEYFEEAEFLEETGNYKEAIKKLDTLLSINPDYVPAYINRGADKSSLNDYPGAIADYSSAIEKDSANVLAYLNRGKNQKRMQEYNKAISDFNKSLSLKGYNKNGLTLIINKNNIFNKKKVTDLEPSIKEILFERGIAYYQIDSLQYALKDFDMCIEWNASYNDWEFEFEIDAECYYWRGITYISLGHRNEGCEDLTRAANLGDKGAMLVIDKYCK